MEARVAKILKEKKRLGVGELVVEVNLRRGRLPKIAEADLTLAKALDSLAKRDVVLRQR